VGEVSFRAYCHLRGSRRTFTIDTCHLKRKGGYLMSSRQLEIYDLLKSQYPPTLSEITRADGLKSSSTVHGHLDKMRGNGYIDFVNTSARTLRIVV